MSRTHHGLLCLILIFQINLLAAQSSFIPQSVGAGINSSYDEINPVISPDGKTLFFSRTNHPDNTYGDHDSQDIWMSTLEENGTWSNAIRVSGLNIGRYNAVLSALEDGKTVVINGVYNRKANTWRKRGLSTAYRMGEGWSTPERLYVHKLSKRNRGTKSSASMSADGEYIVFSFSRTYNSDKSNLFISKRKENGVWSRPVPIRDLNTKFIEEAPFLAPDKVTLYFASDRREKGKFDIYKSVRNSDDPRKWGPPVLLNDTINSPSWDSYFKTNNKGSMAYFSSTRESMNGADILKVKMFEENPFVIVSGTIANAASGRLLTEKKFTLLVNDQPVSDVAFNSDSASYTVKLPLQKKYTLSVSTPNYKGIPVTVDVSDVREFTQKNQNLKATPLPYVQLKGRLLVRSTSEKIPGSAQPKIVVNGTRADSALINSDGTYELKLNHGSRYYVQVDGRRFEPLPKLIDLTSVDEYKEIEADLEADAEKMAVVVGNVINKKTNKPLQATDGVKINVEGIENAYASIDEATGKYELKLPLGQTYTINAAAPDYYPVYETIEIAKEKTNVKIYKDLVIVPIEVGQSIRLNNIFFETGKSALKKESFPELDRVANFLLGNGEIKIEIGGHTDNVGKAETNQRLSQARAKAVTDYIISRGITKDRITSKGYGLTKPVASNATKEGKAQNRRVEFTILDK